MDELLQFVDQMITDKKIEVSSGTRAMFRQELAEKLNAQIELALIYALPEQSAIELSKKIDDANFDESKVFELIQNSGIDVQKIALETMMKFRELYLS